MSNVLLGFVDAKNQLGGVISIIYDSLAEVTDLIVHFLAIITEFFTHFVDSLIITLKLFKHGDRSINLKFGFIKSRIQHIVLKFQIMIIGLKINHDFNKWLRHIFHCIPNEPLELHKVQLIHVDTFLELIFHFF